MAILASVSACTKSTMRFQAASCAGAYIPVQPGVMRPSGETQVISVTTRPAPPLARSARCTRCQSVGVPSAARYCAIGETTTRFSRCIPRKRKGVNMGGRAALGLWPVACSSNHISAPSSHALSRWRKFSCEMRCERVSKE